MEEVAADVLMGSKEDHLYLEIEGWQAMPVLRFRGEEVDTGVRAMVDALQVGAEDALVFRRTSCLAPDETFGPGDVHGAFARWCRSGRTGDGVMADLARYVGLVQLGEQLRSAVNRMADTLVMLHRHQNGHPYRVHRMVHPDLQSLDLRDLSSLEDEEVMAICWNSGRYAHFRDIFVTTAVRGLQAYPFVARMQLAELEDAVREAKGSIPVLRPLVVARRAMREAGAFPGTRHVLHDLDPRGVRRARRALRRSMIPCSMVVGQDRMVRFLKGERVIIPGCLYDYAVINTIGAVRHGVDPAQYHVPFGLTVFAKTGERIANGCVYFRGAPMLDQMTALRLHAGDPETERGMLSQMNLSFPSAAIVGSGLEDRLEPRQALDGPPLLVRESYIGDLSREEAEMRERAIRTSYAVLRRMLPFAGEGVDAVAAMEGTLNTEVDEKALEAAVTRLRIGRYHEAA